MRGLVAYEVNVRSYSACNEENNYNLYKCKQENVRKQQVEGDSGNGTGETFLPDIVSLMEFLG